MNFKLEDLYKLKSDGTFLFRDISFSLKKGDILTISGPSGVGKTTLLKCIAQLTLYEGGSIYLNDRTPEEYGIPVWRTRVMYVPQRTPIMPGTPMEFYNKMSDFGAQRTIYHNDPIEISQRWGISEELWDKPWNHLSGGEIQRVSLAIAISCNPDVLLLDEPTSALDPNTTLLVEETLKEHTCIIVTHSPEQETRISTKTYKLNHYYENRHAEIYQFINQFLMVK
ncbi:unnamed protein product [Rhizophagus irregularis]|uniref:ABC transporter domain-containing protein n=1 Tax=Rhizophagus irregularis TaxID=588596 RepID=A0A916ECX4_9GLOM|nr:unnamed protein product [Rhizophagus irregularis]CAB5209946.1 unnamed protein product [Rhizophagus irregularis]CAB5377950.1 unnamed protein product [Rhizophagus irregularis]